MRIYQNKSFQRDAKGVDISDDDCRAAIEKAEKGLVDADLGGGIIKQRIALGNRGASKGARSIIFYHRGTRAIFLHVFSKGTKANVTATQLAEYQAAAKELANLTDRQLQDLCEKAGWREVTT